LGPQGSGVYSARDEKKVEQDGLRRMSIDMFDSNNNPNNTTSNEITNSGQKILSSSSTNKLNVLENSPQKLSP